MPAKAAAAPKTNRRIQVRKSGVHGKGVFALQDIPEGVTLIEYVGEIGRASCRERVYGLV